MLEVSEDFVFHLGIFLRMQWNFLTAEISDSYDDMYILIAF